ncbi:MAG TPA: cupin [Desulfobacteraceae bacterium]|nr:cupin [Desulfobacteraceae bacterium]
MDINVINLKDKAALIEDIHTYRRVARMNDYEFKLIKVQRTFVWHKHPDTDEVFYAVEGGFDIELRDKTLTLSQGEMAVIPKNVEHRPVCRELCTIMLIEPAGTVNTGDAGGDMTDTVIEDI